MRHLLLLPCVSTIVTLSPKCFPFQFSIEEIKFPLNLKSPSSLLIRSFYRQEVTPIRNDSTFTPINKVLLTLESLVIPSQKFFFSTKIKRLVQNVHFYIPFPSILILLRSRCFFNTPPLLPFICSFRFMMNRRPDQTQLYPSKTIRVESYVPLFRSRTVQGKS